MDARNPWLGLASFTEETREYFYGREEEVAELARRVQRKLLTVLFGQSGLGKTSILRAGLVPRLRGQGYCPVYVRIDYARQAPEPAEQIKQAIARTARHSGQWTQAGVAVQGESLWEFLHHRDDVLRDESGATLIPLLIFDQFEEIFTLAQTDDFGRARAARFIADLADLVENRPPKELEAKLDRDDSAAEDFDFARSDYRVLIALREDYLAPLEGLKAAMPSITQNRLRLAPMTGQQALAAVMRPGKLLVTEEVAGAIVRFVAGGAEIANAEVEPSLLSLICRELNDTRIAQGRSEISLDLLAGSHASILTNFYERSLADQPAAMRRIIEDELLTDSGFRENVAEEKLLSSFAVAGASPTTLATLVNRRLLRIEERLDVRRVELTHDVLCGVVKSSRDLRQEREARDASERLLVEQREKELSARKALVRARQIAAFCVLLAIGAVVAAGMAYVSTQRARRAEAQAQETRQQTEKARGQAEQLLGYLTEDFSHELESFGRQDILAELAKRQVDYFTALPDALKGPDTQRNGALAMVQFAAAARRMGRIEEAGTVAGQALKLLERLHTAGDNSDHTLIALAQGYDVQASVSGEQQSADTIPIAHKGVALLRLVAEDRHASMAIRRAYVGALTGLGYQQMRVTKYDDAHVSERTAMKVAEAAGVTDMTQIDMAALYAYAGAWDVQSLFSSGHDEEARSVGAKADAMVDKVLAVRPTHLLALKSQQLLGSNLGFAALNDMNPARAMPLFERALNSSKNLSRLDPGNKVIRFNLAVTIASVGDALWSMGKPREALQRNLDSLQIFKGPRTAAAVSPDGVSKRAGYYIRAVDVGDTTSLPWQLAEIRLDLDYMSAHEPAGSTLLAASRCIAKAGDAEAARLMGDFATSIRIARECRSILYGLRTNGPIESVAKNLTLFYELRTLAEAEYATGDYPAAERDLRDSLAARAGFPIASVSDYRDQAENFVYLAMSLAAQGKLADAQTTIAPIVKLQRQYKAVNHGDQTQLVELASTLYALSLSDPAHRDALRKEAAALISSVPAEMRTLHSVRQWRERIARGAPTT